MESGHNCTLTVKDYNVIPKLTIWYWQFFANKWKQWSTINERNPQTKMYVFSSAVFTEEKRRHLRITNFWIIHPFSQIRYTI